MSREVEKEDYKLSAVFPSLGTIVLSGVDVSPLVCQQEVLDGEARTKREECPFESSEPALFTRSPPSYRCVISSRITPVTYAAA